MHPLYLTEDDETAEETVIKQNDSQSSCWVALESSRGSHHWLPWRPDIQSGEGEEDVEDPERLVLFDDISKCVFRLKSQQNTFTLVLEYLTLLGLDARSTAVPSQGPVHQRTMQTTLENVDTFMKTRSYEIEGCKHSNIDSKQKSKVVINIVNQTLPKFSGWQKSVLTIGLLNWKLEELGNLEHMEKKERKAKYKEVKRFAKRVLKEEANRNDLMVWGEYAGLEWAMGNKEDGRKVLETTFMMRSGNVQTMKDLTNQCVMSKLYRNYAQLELGLLRSCQENNIHKMHQANSSSKERILYVLCILGTGDTFTATKDYFVPGTKLLKARKGFQQYLEILLEEQACMLSSPDVPSDLPMVQHLGPVVLHWAVCYAIFQYITVDITAANAVFQQVLGNLSTAEPKACDDDHAPLPCYYQSLVERLQVGQLTLLQYYTSTSIVPLNTLRVPLLMTLSQLPDHPSLLQMYTEMESAGHLAGQLRRSLVGVAKKSHTPLVWVYVVLAELHRIHILKKHQQALATSIPGSQGWYCKLQCMKCCINHVNIYHKHIFIVQYNCVTNDCIHYVQLF